MGRWDWGQIQGCSFIGLGWGALEVGEAGAGDHHEAREGPYSREDRSHNKNDSIDPVLTVYQRLSI